jgi:hypothetical protein
MKKIYLAVVLIMTSCAAHNMTTIDATTADFAGVERPYTQKWVGGVPGSSSGTALYLPASVFKGKAFIAMYYGSSKSNSFNYTTTDRQQIVVRFQNNENEWRGVKIMDLDSTKEYGNDFPKVTKLPLTLKANQVLIAFKGDKRDKLKYILIDKIEERPMLAFPSMPQ